MSIDSSSQLFRDKSEESEKVIVKRLVDLIPSSASSTEIPVSQYSSILSYIEKLKTYDGSLELFETEFLSRYTSEHNLPSNKNINNDESEIVCTRHIPVSDSDIQKHLYYLYPPLKDPRIRDALLEDDGDLPPDENNGQQCYLRMCKEMGIPCINIFYNALLGTHVDLKYYGLGRHAMRAICTALEKNETVRSIDLTGNILDQDDCYHLGKLIGLNKNIQELILRHCKIGPKNIKFVIEKVSSGNIVKLDLTYNNLWDDGIAAFVEKFYSSTATKYLNLSHNLIGQDGALQLADLLEFNTQIRYLNLSWNFIESNNGVNALLSSLSESHCLEELIFKWNGLAGTQIIGDSIAKVIAHVDTLTLLDLSSNRLCGEAIKEISDAIPKSPSLKTLNLSKNRLSPNDALLLLRNMLNPDVGLRNLLLDDIWIDQKFVELRSSILLMEHHHKSIITYGGVDKETTITGPDPRRLLLLRAAYLGKKPKKHKIDISVFFLRLHQEKETILLDELLKTTKENKIPLDQDFIKELARVFPGSKSVKQPLINLSEIANYIHRLWPEARVPPPTPPKPLKKKQSQKKARVRTTVAVVHCHRNLPIVNEKKSKRKSQQKIIFGVKSLLTVKKSANRDTKGLIVWR